MPRLSLWRNDTKTNDYRFIDRHIGEYFAVSGIGIYVHKYLGPETIGDSSGSGDATLPTYDEENPLFIEDLLFLENRNRSYDPNVYEIYSIFNVQNLDWQMTQVGLFMKSDILYISVHYNQMIDVFGRKLMNGDVLEIPNLKDYHPLNQDIPKPLPKFYVITEALFASEGFSPTWYPHVWRVKCVPLVGSQEYNTILDQYMDTHGDINGDDGMGNNSGTLKEWMATCAANLDINDAIVEQAEIDVDRSGYDVTPYYVVPQYSADGEAETVTGHYVGYLTGDGLPENALPATVGVQFPSNPSNGDYVLRTDYRPNRLFRYNGTIWVKIEDNVRTDLTPGPDNQTQRSEFVNNTETVQTTDRGEVPSRQALSKLLKPEADN